MNNFKNWLTVFIIIFSSTCFASPDSVEVKKINEQIEILSNKVNEVKRDQLNYCVEKDLLKETYRVNYERINLFIIIILGLFGVLSFLGLKDINSIKKEYKDELEKLRNLKEEFNCKLKDFDISTKQYDRKISEIITQNEEQNKKIKLLEFKEKINNLYSEKKYDIGLDYCIAALEQFADDLILLDYKARFCIKLQKYNEAIDTYLILLKKDPTNASAIVNLAECYLFIEKTSESNQILKENSGLVAKHFEMHHRKMEDMLSLFELLDLFNNKKDKDLKGKVIDKIDSKDKKLIKKIHAWDVEDAIGYLFYKPDSSSKIILINYLRYLDGQLSGEAAYNSITEAK